MLSGYNKENFGAPHNAAGIRKSPSPPVPAALFIRGITVRGRVVIFMNNAYVQTDSGRRPALAALLASVFLLGGCAPAETGNGVSSDGGTESAFSGGSSSVLDSIQLSDIEVPAKAQASESSEVYGVLITLTGSGAVCDSDLVICDGDTVTITGGGTYTLTGELSGQIHVDSDENSKITLVFNGVCVESPDSSALFIKSSPKKTVISTASGSVNILRDGDVYDESICDEKDGDVPDAALYSRDDLKLSGTGGLYIVSAYHRGINCKDDLEIENGDIFVVSGDDAVRGKDSVTVTGGVLSLKTDGNGIRSSGSDEDLSKGNILISGGSVSIVAGGDGVDAENTLTLSGGSISLLTGGGYENGRSHSDGFGGGGGPGAFPGGGGFDRGDPGAFPGGGFFTTAFQTSDSSQSSESAKGFKAASRIIISGGAFFADSADDGVHSDSSITVSGGSLYIRSGDDGLHADVSLTFCGGDVLVEESYEGAEAVTILISGGTLRFYADDDGINAGTSLSLGGGGPGGMPGGMGESGTGGLDITGGYVVINASGDGIDSNNTVTMSSGTVIVYGPEGSGNGALDYAADFTFTGGTLIALGSSGMAQSVTASQGGVIALRTNTIKSGTLLNISDGCGHSLMCIESPKSYSHIVFASSELSSGESVTLSTGGSHSGVCADGVYSGGEYSGGTVLTVVKAS